MDPIIARIMNGLSEDARLCLIAVLGEAVNTVRNIDSLCPYEFAGCTAGGPLCVRLEMLLRELQTDRETTPDLWAHGEGSATPGPSDPASDKCGGRPGGGCLWLG